MSKEIFGAGHEFDDIIAVIESAKARAMRAANVELINMYWEIGAYVSERVSANGWGKSTVKEFSEYFSGARKEFTLPYAYSLPPFYSKVLKEIAKIPYGQLISYKNLSSKAGNIKAVRACGRACHCNPLPLIIPCHRVTASNGIGGYAYGTEVKRKLLEIEGIKIPDEKQ